MDDLTISNLTADDGMWVLPALDRLVNEVDRAFAPQRAEPEPTLRVHPHNSCPFCKEPREASRAEAIAAFVECRRQSAQETLDALEKRGFTIVKTK